MARRQQEKSQQTQDEMMVAAIDLFGRKGFFSTTISEITSTAGCYGLTNRMQKRKVISQYV